MKRSVSTSSELNDFIETDDGKKEYNVSKSRLIRLVNWAHVGDLYVPVLVFIVLAGVAIQLVMVLLRHKNDILHAYSSTTQTIELPRSVFDDLGWKALGLVAFLLWYFSKSEASVYVVDFTTFEPPNSWRLNYDEQLRVLKSRECFTEESLAFQNRMLGQSGVGPATAWPPGILLRDKNEIDTSIEAARSESEMVMFDCVRNLLDKTKTNARDVDFLVVNCSLFSPTPSLCTMIINEFNMRSDISSYNLSGMGCSAGLISIELVRHLLRSRPNSLAVVVSHENLTQALYEGNERAFLLQNTLFRCGGAAILLSNKWLDGHRSYFKLLHVVRTQFVSEDSYGCVYETEDHLMKRGVRLSKDIVKVAGRALEKNLTSMGPHILPITEQIKTGYSMLKTVLAKKFKWPKPETYTPDWKRGIDHFCIHAGGRGVIDGIEKNLKLTPAHVAASRHALYTYGNTSSSSIWYEMDYIRTNTKLSRGQRVLQIAFGSGFKCNSAAWICLNNNKATDEYVHNDCYKSDSLTIAKDRRNIIQQKQEKQEGKEKETASAAASSSSEPKKEK